jgi:hypothetical protein
MTTLDAPSRESCQVRRERTNSPVQALLLLNEPQFIEASRALAERTFRECHSNDRDRAVYLFRLATARCPDAGDLAELSAALREFRAHYASHPEAARQLIKIGETQRDPRLSPAELAAWTMIGNVVLNLDEAISKG